jgi:hypothetical protein
VGESLCNRTAHRPPHGYRFLPIIFGAGEQHLIWHLNLAILMFLLFILPNVYRALAPPISLPLMSNPDSFEASPEDLLSWIASEIPSKLNDSQRRWLDTQSKALNTSNEQIMNDVLAEWLTRHPNVNRHADSLGDSLLEALEDFIARHYKEFLPVGAID